MASSTSRPFRQNSLDTLSSEVLLEILMQVDYLTIHYTLTRVCRRFYQIIKRPPTCISYQSLSCSRVWTKNLLLERLYEFENKLFIADLRRQPLLRDNSTPTGRLYHYTDTSATIHPCFKHLYANFSVLEERYIEINDVGFIPPGQESFIPLARARMKTENATHPPAVNVFITSPGIFTPETDKLSKRNVFETESEEVITDQKAWGGNGGVTFAQVVEGALEIINTEGEEVRSLQSETMKMERMKLWPKGFVRLFDVVNVVCHTALSAGILEIKVEFPYNHPEASSVVLPPSAESVRLPKPKEAQTNNVNKENFTKVPNNLTEPVERFSALTALIKTNQAQVACAQRGI